MPIHMECQCYILADGSLLLEPGKITTQCVHLAGMWGSGKRMIIKKRQGLTLQIALKPEAFVCLWKVGLSSAFIHQSVFGVLQ